VQTRPEGDVRRRRVLGLQTAYLLQGTGEWQLRAHEEELAGEERPVQLPGGQDSFRRNKRSLWAGAGGPRFFSSAEAAEELPQVADEEVRYLVGGVVHAAIELCPTYGVLVVARGAGALVLDPFLHGTERYAIIPFNVR